MRVSRRVTFIACRITCITVLLGLASTSISGSAAAQNPKPVAAPLAAAATPAQPVAAPPTPLAAQPPAPPSTPAPPPLPGTEAAAPEPPKPAPDKGDFRLTYEKTADPGHKELEAMFKDSKLFEEALKALNGTLALPRDVKVVLRDCGTSDVLFEPQIPRVSVCYELVDALAAVIASDAKTQEEANQAGVAIASATIYLFVREAARALIDLQALPVAGRPDEAVDPLTTLIQQATGEEGEQQALNGVQTLLAEEGKAKSRAVLSGLAYWKAHPLDPQRLDRVLCWVYGKNPAKFQDLVGDGTLSAERAEHCPSEFLSMAQTWQPMLAPYIKKRPGT